jgi:NAD(P)-dependent dehydrogenase (short-subunit alcohol dehydrogenase family)
VGVVLVTGCSSGIGLETALAFARRGDRVVASMRDPARAGLLLERATVEGVRVDAVPLDVVTLDVTDDASVTAAVAEVEQRHGPIDVLVNNAGVAITGPVETVDLERAHALVETNLWGPVRTTRAVLPSMRARETGVIVNVSSTAGLVAGAPYSGFYGASKHALAALTEAMAMEVEPFGVRVACVAPGRFATEVFTSGGWGRVADPAGPYAADEAWMARFTEVGAPDAGDPADVAAAIVAVVEDQAAPLHLLVGDDAHTWVGLHERADSFEAWVGLVRELAEGIAGPRPAPGPLA